MDEVGTSMPWKTLDRRGSRCGCIRVADRPAEEDRRYLDEILPYLTPDGRSIGEWNLRHFKTIAPISFNADISMGDVIVSGNRVQLQQVVIDLILNGIEAMAEVVDRSRLLSIGVRTSEE
jgi:signal transduction histidine kinase